MKGKLLQEVWDTFSEEENVQIKERAQELRQQYLTLQDLRKAHDLILTICRRTGQDRV